MAFIIVSNVYSNFFLKNNIYNILMCVYEEKEYMKEFQCK